MCGIAGLIADPLPPTAAATMGAMVAALARRGPDGEGIHCWPAAIFGHRRLAIFDLTGAGRQPMLSEDGQTGVVFNGAIYNFLDLRARLESRGRRFRSRCDTEVLVQGYEEWGVDELVSRLRGMFAFAVWDNRRRVLYLVRDRLGVKPLLYSESGGRIAFASTLPALARAGFTGNVDAAAMLDFFEFGWVSEDRSILEGAKKVPAATILEWRDGASSMRRYWTPPEPGTSRLSFEQAVEETERILLEAVKLRLEADVPVAALLSGGVDSSLICWAMAKLNANITSFTVATPGDSADESAAAVRTARALGIPHRVVELPPTAAPELDDLLNAYGEPFACASALGMLRVSRAIRPHATVLLTGDGGDDVFLGYTHHRNFWRAQRLANRAPESMTRLWPALNSGFRAAPALRRPARLLDYAFHGLAAVTRAHDGLPYYDGMLGDRLARLKLPDREIPPSSGRTLLGDFLKYEWRTRFLAEYMTKVDGATMFHGIEARSPFLDQRVWELAAALPFDVRLRRGELKAVLREIARRNAGLEIAARPKQGFTIPIGRWLAGAWKPLLVDLCGGSELERGGWIQREPLRAAVDAAIRSGATPQQLWYLVVAERWLRR